MEPIEETRLGRPYFRCPVCPFGVIDNRETVAAHIHDHDPHPTIEDRLNPPPEPKPKRTKE